MNIQPYRACLPACMGGFCPRRDHCQRHVTSHRDFVVERLCARGHESPWPVIVITPARQPITEAA